MKTLPRSFGLQKIFVQLRHGAFKDLARRNFASLWRRVNRRRSRFPFMVAVEVTNECMLDCIICPHSRLKEKTGYMSLDLFHKIIDECSRHPSLGDLVFTGPGEPLLHPKLLEMSKLAKRKRIPYVRLITNAILLTRQKTPQILADSGLDEIGLSLDAATQRTYQKIKRSSKFQIAQENIPYFLNQKKKRWKPFVSLHILKMRETAGEISDFVKKWSSLLGKGDHIFIKDVHNFAGQVEDRRLEEQIHRRERYPCRQLWEFLYVSWNGDVMPCCMDVFKKLKLGNLRNSSLQQLWDSSFLQGIRRIRLQERYEEIPLCSHCGNWWYLGGEPKGR